jgi:peptide/nickel transport system substrate-binding protein
MQLSSRLQPAATTVRLLVLVLVALLVATGCEMRGQNTVDEPAVEQGESTPALHPEPTPHDASDDGTISPSQPEDPVLQAPVRVAEGGAHEPRTLNPILVADPLSEELSRMIFSGLVRANPETGQPEGDLAHDWDVSDDNTIYTFHLRDGVLWHDGQPFSAHDVVFTYRLMSDHRTHSPRYSRLVERVLDVEAVDSMTVRFRLVNADASFITTLATLGIVPEHVLSSVLPSELVTDPFGISVAIGTGPFRLTQWIRGERIFFEKNETYVHGAPHIDQYEYVVVADGDELLAGLELGLIDWARIDPSYMDEAADIDGVETRALPGYEMIYVALQLDPAKAPLLQDHRVRAALMLALDRDDAIERVWHGQARIADGTIPPASWAYTSSDMSAYRQDVERATGLLSEAGWMLGDDGVRYRNGQPLQITLVTNGDNPARRQLANWIVARWRDVGFDARTEFETWSGVRERVTNTREFEALLLGLRGEIDPDQYELWSSDSIHDGLNIGGYVNLEVDRLLAEALAEHDPDLRADLYREAQEVVLGDIPILPICFPDLTLAVGPRLHDVNITAILVRNRATIESWNPEPGDGEP